jgi:hypothetical protein
MSAAATTRSTQSQILRLAGDRTFERDGGEHYPPFTTPMVLLSQDVVFPLPFDRLS